MQKGSETCQALCARKSGKEVLYRGVQKGTQCGPHAAIQHGGCMDLEKRLPFSMPIGSSGRFRRASRGLAGGVGERDDSLQEKQSIAFKSRVLIHRPRLFLPVGMFHFSGYSGSLLWAKDKKSVDLFPGLLNYISVFFPTRPVLSGV